ncbi:tRNA (guanosine(46)-N7)-methyltransferase TrmB [Hydrogenimonas sp.]
MPHINVESFNIPVMPFKKDGIEFLWYAKNIDHPDEGLIGVQVGSVPFLLQVKPKNATVLIKTEKVSRPSPNTLVKKALQALIETAKPKVLFSNISNIEQAKLKEPLPFLKEIGEFDADLLPKKPIWVEVGFGSGRHLLHQAKEHPDVHLIGLEIHRPSLEQVMRRIDLEGLENVWVVDYDARLFMELLPSDSIERLFVHFPVPWDKKPHRRVISDAFLDESMRVLNPGGTLELRTDSENYFKYAMEVFAKPKNVKLTLEKNLEGAVRSKYEDRWLRMNKNIYEIHVESLEASPDKVFEGSFSFPGDLSISELYAKKPSKAWVKPDCFAHVERFYAINEKEGLIRVALGSVERPEHKYILIHGEKTVYYPQNPVKTATNLRAHKILLEWMNCQA